MIIISKLLIIGVLLIANMALALTQLRGGMPYVPSSEGLARLIMNAHLTGSNSERPMKCFAEYIKKSHGIGSKYSADYRSCLEKSRNDRNTIDMEVAIERQGIITEAEGICQKLTRCNKMKNSLALFNCHAEVGSNNTESSYTISANASDFAIMVQESYRTISLREEKCCSQSERVYVESTTGSYRFLQLCLNGFDGSKPHGVVAMVESKPTDASTSSSSTHKWTNSTPWPTTASTTAESSVATDTSSTTAEPTPSTVKTAADLASTTENVYVPWTPPSPIPEANVDELAVTNI